MRGAMLFNFHLRPLETVTPWYYDGQPFLHWFGLTDGWYWLDAGTATLFQYTDVILHHWEISPADGSYRSYVDYQVVRLWEDLQERLPHILEPIPHHVLQRIQPGYQAVHWRDAIVDCLIPDDVDVSASAVVRLEQATEWLTNRWLDVGYLRAGPRIWFWNDDEWSHGVLKP